MERVGVDGLGAWVVGGVVAVAAAVEVVVAAVASFVDVDPICNKHRQAMVDQSRLNG